MLHDDLSFNTSSADDRAKYESVLNDRASLPAFFRSDWTYEPPVLAPAGKLNIYYARFSTENQRKESNQDQFREGYDRLKREGFDPDRFTYMCDDAVSGVLDSRTEFDRILALVRQGRVELLVVIHQDRFSRGVNVQAMVMDIVYNGGRFISLAEGTDTNQPGWEMKVGMVGLMNNQFVKKTQERSRDGLRGRHRHPSGSTGHLPYGYRSVPEGLLADGIQTSADSPVLSRPSDDVPSREHRPRMCVVVYAAAAAFILKLFELFAVENYSFAMLVRWVEAHRHEYPPLNQNRVKGKARQKRVYEAYLRAILTNRKYIGEWGLGFTKSVYNSAGEKRARKVDPSEVLWQRRDHLAIIPMELWNAAQAKLAKLKEIHGLRTNHKQRGPREHYLILYARSLTQGLVIGDCCGSRMVAYSSSDRRLQCQGVRKGICSNNVTLPLAPTDTAVLGALVELLKGHREWVELTITSTRALIEKQLRTSEGDRDRLVAQIEDVGARVANIVETIERGNASAALNGRLNSLEAEQAKLKSQLDDLDTLRQAEQSIPDAAWFDRALGDLAALLEGDVAKVAHVLRPLIKKIVAVPVKLPWQRRGGYHLHVTFDLRSGLTAIAKAKLPPVVANAVIASTPDETTVTLDLTTQAIDETRMREIDVMVEQGAMWTVIGKRFDTSPAWLKKLYLRWRQPPA